MSNILFKLLFAIYKHVIRRGKGLFKLLFVVDDLIRLVTMTLLFGFIAWRLNLPRFLTILLVLLGVVVDFHDFIYDTKISQIELEKD